MTEQGMVEFDDILHLFATLGFDGTAPPTPTATIKAINGEVGREIQNMAGCAIEHYFQKFKPWCKKSIETFGEGEIHSRFLKLFQMGVLDFQWDYIDKSKGLDGTFMILMIWCGEKYEDYRMVADVIGEPFIIGGEK